jgi:hypothetical protein
LQVGLQPPSECAAVTQTLPVFLDTEPKAETSAASEARQGDAAFNAQLMGQGGQRRGIRAGLKAVETWQGAYQEREYSGPSDRRLPTGILAKTAV